MRPEHGCSGNVATVRLLPAFGIASMRPEHGCSGNDGSGLPTRQVIPGFNEAGARMLRK